MTISACGGDGGFGAVRWLSGSGRSVSGVRVQPDSRPNSLGFGAGGRIVHDVIALSRAAWDLLGKITESVSTIAAKNQALSGAKASLTQDEPLVFDVGKDYSKENLRGVNFNGAVLSRANFSRSDLTGADFSLGEVGDANFDAADLTGAKFDFTFVSDASFIGADLRGTDLSKVLGLTAAQLRSAMYDTSTKLPPNLSSMAASTFPVSPSVVVYA